MNADFIDTSVLVKHYHAEHGTEIFDQLWNDLTNVLVVSRLAVVEMMSALAAKTRAGLISEGQFQTLRRRFTADLTKNKRLTAIRMLVSHYRDAEKLFSTVGLTRRLRTLDALQLAVAVDLYRKQPICRVVSADRDLLAVATDLGIATLDPENPT